MKSYSHHANRLVDFAIVLGFLLLIAGWIAA